MTPNWGLEGPWGSKTVLKSSWFGSLVVLWFEIASFALLGSFWGRFGVLLGSFWCFFGLLKVLESSFRRRFLVFMVSLCSLLFRPRVRRFVLVNSSTHQPMALRHFLTRPGGLRAARLNPPPPEGSERVQIEIEIFFEFLFEFFELKESSQGPRIPHPPS